MRRNMMGKKAAGGAAHRYWRLLADDVSWSASFGGYYQIVNIYSLFASADNTGTDLALSKDSFSSSEFSATFSAEKANDGDQVTSWQTFNPSTTPQWWYVDLVTPSEVHSLYIRSVSGGVFKSKTLLLQWSDNGASWTTQNSIPTVGIFEEYFDNL